MFKNAAQFVLQSWSKNVLQDLMSSVFEFTFANITVLLKISYCISWGANGDHFIWLSWIIKIFKPQMISENAYECSKHFWAISLSTCGSCLHNDFIYWNPSLLKSSRFLILIAFRTCVERCLSFVTEISSPKIGINLRIIMSIIFIIWVLIFHIFKFSIYF